MHPVILPRSRSLVAVAAASLLAIFSGGCSRHARVADLLAQAELDFASSRYDQAEIEYKNVLQLDPQNAPSIARLGLIFHEEGREARAFPFLVKTRELQPENLEARLRLGFAFLASGSADDARKEALFILERRPQDQAAPVLLVEATGLKPTEISDTRQRLLALPQGAAKGAPALVALGVLDLRENKIKEAEAAFKLAQETDPKSAEAATAIGMLRWAQNDLPAADAALKEAAALSPDRSPRQLKYAQFKIQTGDPAAAKILLEAMSRKTPEYISVWIWLAEVAVAEKKFAEADAFLAHAFARDPLHPEAMMLGARLHLAKGETDKAIADLEKLILLFPKSPQIAYQLGMAYAASGDNAKALSRLSQAIAAAPAMSHAVLALAEINLRRRDFSAAVVTLKQLGQERPDIPAARAMLAEAYRGLGNLDEATALYRKLEEQFPLDAKTPFWRGMVLLQQNKGAEARRAFERALELAPQNLAALEQLTELDLRTKKYADATRRLATAVAATPKNADLQLQLAKVNFAQGDRGAAEANLQKAIEFAPESPGPSLALGRMYASQGLNDKALATLQKSTTAFPRNATAPLLIGAIYDGQKNYPAARDAYEQALALDAKSSVALNNLSYLYAERFEQLDKAFEMAQRAKALAPQDPRTADTLGWILARKKQYPQALAMLVDCAEKLPAESEVQYHLGATHYMLGDEEAARVALQRALSLSTSFLGADEARQRLQILALDPSQATPAEMRGLEKRVGEHADDSVAQLRLADSYQRAGELDHAMVAYRAALLANPKNARAAISLARLHDRRGDLPSALEAAKAARALAPNDPAIAHTLGRLAFQSGDHRWAAGLLQDAARQLPENPDASFDWAEAAYSVGQTAEAETAAHHALALSATFSRAKQASQFLALREFASDPARAAGGVATAEAVLKSDPTSVPALDVLATASEQKLDRAAAKQACERMLKIFPDFAPAQKHLVVLYAANPADDLKAIALATKARLAFPTDLELGRAIGIVAYRQGDYARAANLLQASAAQHGKDGELMYYLGMAQWRLNKRSEGKLSLQRALEFGVNDTLASEARKSLATLD